MNLSKEQKDGFVMKLLSDMAEQQQRYPPDNQLPEEVFNEDLLSEIRGFADSLWLTKQKGTQITHLTNENKQLRAKLSEKDEEIQQTNRFYEVLLKRLTDKLNIQLASFLKVDVL